MEKLPFLLECCGGTYFLAIPFVGYTRLTEVSYALLALAAICFLPLLLLFRMSRLNQALFVAVLSGSLFAGLQVALDSDYVKFALQSVDASVADEGLLREGYRFYQESLPSAENLHELDVHTREWRRKPHVIENLLTSEETSQLASVILANRSRFYHVDHLAFPLPFFTLGPYWGYHTFDATANHNVQKKRPTHPYKLSTTFTEYNTAVAADRELMMSSFPGLYEKVREGLSRSLNTSLPIKHLPGVSVPGFHIIPSHFAWTLQVFRFHTDESYEMFLEAPEGKLANLDYREEKCDPSSRISFTLPIKMPDEGSGLNYIDFGMGKGDSLDNKLKKRASRRKCSARYPHLCYTQKRQMYKEGNLVVHAGMLIHSIGHWNYSGYSTQRITMQGFGFKCDDAWYIYW